MARKFRAVNNIETSFTLSNGLKLDLPQRDPDKPRDSLVDEYTFTDILICSRTAPDGAAGTWLSVTITVDFSELGQINLIYFG
jgi:hypothetical protein